MTLLSCPECGREVSDRALACPNCGLPVANVVRTDRIKEAWDVALENPSEAYPAEDPVYREAFVAFDKNGGNAMATWSWVAFLFGGFWYLYKGLWVKFLLLIGIALFTGGFGWFLSIPYTSLMGKYDYYLLKVHKKQWGWSA